ncbi:hypothetical protein AX17_007188 [Amanita inopinata Kibby_2008]|nr:hypothetical protein AX17_007188 [Amanita inopinata Kibby_2008]
MSAISGCTSSSVDRFILSDSLDPPSTSGGARRSANHRSPKPTRALHNRIEPLRESRSQPSSPTISKHAATFSTPSTNFIHSPADRLEEDTRRTEGVHNRCWSYATASASTSTINEAGRKDNKGVIAGFGKTLTRKVSSKWRKTGGGSIAIITEGDDTGDSPAASSSLRGRPTAIASKDTMTSGLKADFAKRSESVGVEEPHRSGVRASPPGSGRERVRKMRSSRYSMRISVESKPASNPFVFPLPRASTPSTPNSFDNEKSPNFNHPRLTTPRPSDASVDGLTASDKANGNKLWKLMKRISTGGLRDKYLSHSHSKSQAHLALYSEESLSRGSSPARHAPPPVPAIPKDFHHLLAGTSSATTPPRPVSSDGHGERTTANNSPYTPSVKSKRETEKDRSASSPMPTTPQRRIMGRIRPISSVSILRRRPSTSGLSTPNRHGNSHTPNIDLESLPVIHIKPLTPSRPRTATPSPSPISPSPASSESVQFFSSNPNWNSNGGGKSYNGRTRSLRSTRSSSSSLTGGDSNSSSHHHNTYNNIANQNYSTPNIPPMPVNPHLMVAKHIVPPSELLEKIGKGKVMVGEDGEGMAQTRSLGASYARSLSSKRSAKVDLHLPLPPASSQTSSSSISVKKESSGSPSEHWSFYRSPDTELPSLPFPPRRRAERGEKDRDSITGRRTDGGTGTGSWGRDSIRSVSTDMSRRLDLLSTPTSSPSAGVTAFPSSNSLRVPRMLSANNSVEILMSEGEELFTPALSTFGRVMGKQFGMESIEEPKSSLTSASSNKSRLLALTPLSSPPLSCMSSPLSLSPTARSMPVSPRQDPTSILPPLGPEANSNANANTSTSTSTGTSMSMSTNALGTFLRKLSISSVSPPPRPTRRVRRPSMSAKEGKGEVGVGVGGSSSGAANESQTVPPQSRRPRKLVRKSSLKSVPPSRGGNATNTNNNNTNANATNMTATISSTTSSAITSTSTSTSMPMPSMPPMPPVPTTPTSHAAPPEVSISLSTEVRPRKMIGVGISSPKRHSTYPFPGALTEQEKRDKWEDLLERSARAGGTIRLKGEGEGLLSDKMRISVGTTNVSSSPRLSLDGEEEGEVGVGEGVGERDKRQGRMFDDDL